MPIINSPEGATVADLVNTTRTLLTGSLRATRNRLNAAIDDDPTTTSLTLEFDTTGISRDALLEINQELMYVWDIDHTTKQLTVERGYDRTDVANHESGDAVLIDPPFTRAAIYRALLDEVDRLNGSGLFGFGEVTLSVADQKADLGSNVETPVLDVYAVTHDADSDYGPKPIQYRFYRGEEAEDFASNMALQILTPIDDQDVRVTYTHRFGSFTGEDDVVAAVTGIPGYAVPALPYGAAWRLMIQKEALRAQPEAQPASRRAEEVQQQSLAFVAEQFSRQRDQMVSDALAIQQRLHPARIQR